MSDRGPCPTCNKEVDLSREACSECGSPLREPERPVIRPLYGAPPRPPKKP